MSFMKKEYVLKIIVLTIVCFQTLNINAQSLSSIDLTSVKIDDLTDQQILAYLEQAKSSGYNEQELESIARQRGLSESEIAKLRRRLSLLKGGVISESKSSNQNLDKTGRATSNASEAGMSNQIADQESERQLTIFQKKIYGFDLFNSKKLSFTPNINIPTPRDYVLGSGDVINIDFWGEIQQYLTLSINPEGYVRPDKLSPIYVNGLTIKEAENKIIDRLSEIYAGLLSKDNKKPSIFYQLSLGQIRSINISVVGEVQRPGNYSLNSLSTVYTALHAAGGPSESGTFRMIQLIRDNKLKSEVDIYTFLNSGIKHKDARLNDGDVIIVKPFNKRVEIVGEVKRPGLFELKQNESFADILKYAGGFTNSAYKSLVTVKRSGTKEREIFDVIEPDFNSFVPKDGDIYQVTPILDRYRNRVQIEGAVFREGEYQLTENLTLLQLIKKADGLRGDVFMARATVYRTNEDFSQDIVPIDLSKLLAGESEDFLLQREDLVRISSIYDLKQEYYVQVLGEVSETGVYPYFNKMTVQDLIVLAGGLTQGASGSLIEISRRNQKATINISSEIITIQIDKELGLDSENRIIELEPFDQVYVRRTPGYTVQQQVSIEGEISAPGTYSISKKDERVSDLLTRANGLTPFAYPEGAILIRKTEFSSNKSNDEITQEYLQELRSKLLSEESELKNISQERLIERLNKIENRSNVNSSSDDEIGSKIKKELIEDVAAQDTLIRNITIKNEEPVALDLDEILKNPGSKYDFILQPGDVISIPGRLETVRVAGEVTSPLNLRFDKSFNFKDYIEQSGGFLQNAKKSRSYVQYPNGTRRGTKRFLFIKFYPKIEPGTTIFVARKPVKDGLGAQGWVSIASGLATIGLVISQAIQVLNN